MNRLVFAHVPPPFHGQSFMVQQLLDELRSGAVAAGRSLSDLDLTVSASVEITADVDEAAKRHAAGFAFTFGAMGSASSNFYNNAFTRQGWGDDVAEVQRLWMSGDRQAARERVPAEIGLRTNLIGSVDDVRVRLREYRDCGVTTLRIGPMGDDLDTQIAGLGQVMDLVNEINAEPTSADPAAASS